MFTIHNTHSGALFVCFVRKTPKVLNVKIFVLFTQIFVFSNVMFLTTRTRYIDLDCFVFIAALRGQLRTNTFPVLFVWMVGFLGCAELELLHSPSSFWLFFEKKGLPQKVLMRTSQQFRFFLEGEYLKRFFFYFNVGNFPMFGFFSLVHFLRGQQFSQHR